MRRILLVGVSALALVPAISQAQADTATPAVHAFDGSWTVVVGVDGAPDAERRLITTSADSMRIALERDGDDRPPILVYKLDGSEMVNPFGAGTATTRMARGAGDVVLETVYVVRDRPVTVTERLRLNSDRTEMTVERTVRVEHGYQGVPPALESGAPNVSKATVTFRKQP